MTSRHLFFKAMREDLRHKIWMIALSSLGSFLVLPVAWLMLVSGRNNHSGYMRPEMYAYLVETEFRQILLVGGLFVAIVGAVIVGLFGFRYVFHKNMIDTYHSIPVKRRTLFSICWLNGFLIWLVPFLVCLLLTLGMASAYLMGTPGQPWIPAMFAEAFSNVLLLAIVFLLAYHVVLTAVMVSGNILNALVSMMILGLGVIAIYGLGVGFFSIYMDTFYSAVINMEPAVYASPFVSGIYMAVREGETAEFGHIGSVLPIMINFCIMVLFGVLAHVLYQKRSSELAEQGLRNKVFSAVLKFIVSLAAGMGGWMVFYLAVRFGGWGVFGAMLVSVLVFGIMDMIFNMEFKAFFAHKIQMAVTAVIAVAICICFHTDAFGYDTYLPDKEDIAEIAVFENSFTNRSLYYYYNDREYMLENLHFQDVDAAYAFLERMTDKERNNGASDAFEVPVASEVSTSYSALTVTQSRRLYDEAYSRRVPVRVTLKNGRTYYRYYWVSDYDLDVTLPLLADQEYLEKNYLVDRQLAVSFDEILWCGINGPHKETEQSPETLWAIAEAYNKDVLENPATVLLNQGNVLVSLEFQRSSDYYDLYDRTPKGAQAYSLRLDVYDSMEHTIAALKQLGYGEWVEPQKTEDINEIRLFVDYNYGGGYVVTFTSSQELTDAARGYYGVYSDDVVSDTVPVPTERSEETVVVGHGMQTSASEEAVGMDQLYLSITDRAEIQELMQYMSYTTPMRYGTLFRKDYAVVEVITAGGEDIRQYCIKRGDLPEKYILKFSELYDSLKEQ